MTDWIKVFRSLFLRGTFVTSPLRPIVPRKLSKHWYGRLGHVKESWETKLARKKVPAHSVSCRIQQLEQGEITQQEGDQRLPGSLPSSSIFDQTFGSSNSRPRPFSRIPKEMRKKKVRLLFQRVISDLSRHHMAGNRIFEDNGRLSLSGLCSYMARIGVY